MFSKYLINLLQHHIEFIHKIMLYLNYTNFYSIFFGLKALCSIKIFCFNNNLSYTNNPNTHKNIQNYIFTFFNKSIN